MRTDHTNYMWFCGEASIYEIFFFKIFFFLMLKEKKKTPDLEDKMFVVEILN